MLKSMSPNLMVVDVNDTVEYYSRVFGFELVVSNPEDGVFEWAMVKSGNVTFMFQSRESLAGELAMFKNMSVGGALTFFIETDDVERFYHRVKNEAEIVFTPKTTFYGMREFCVRDCNGHFLTFAQRVEQG